MENDLKVRRAREDITQAELAERIGVSRQSINAVEVGRYDPSLELAFALAGYFECAIEDIFAPEAAAPEAAAPEADAGAGTGTGSAADAGVDAGSEATPDPEATADPGGADPDADSDSESWEWGSG
jgi:putative transcriptional regulator